jgi:amidohydrolase
MHACGHDSHTAILLTVLKYFVEHASQLKCRIKFLFTPAEEYTIPGCKELAENGVMDDVNCCLATHCNPDRNIGVMTFTDEALGSNSMGFKVRFYGLSAHAASQQKGKDAILMAVEAITAMEFMAAKELKVTDARLLNIGSIHGGKTNNVICDYVEIFGSCRTHTDEVSDYMERRIQEICQGVALTSGGKVEYERTKLLPYRIQNATLHEKARETGLRVLGEENVVRPATRGLGGEDFGYLTRKKPCYFTFFGCKPADKETVPPVHNSKFCLPNESMIAPIDFTIRFVLDHMLGIEGL